MSSDQRSQGIEACDSSTICIWRFLDGRAGHRNQVLGLTDALARMARVECHDIDVSTTLRGMKSLLPGRLQSLRNLPRPNVLIGAGHSTHVPLLAARQRFGGNSVVIMKPSLPLFLFDLCLIPAADALKRVRGNVVITEGALNRIQRSKTLSRTKGLILIGGPSSHFVWSDEAAIKQIRAVIDSNPSIEWTLTTSRRTPSSFLSIWEQSRCRGQMIPVEQTGPDWLPQQLTSAGSVWVTNDSVSMIYEALTSGAAVGVFTLEKIRKSRVAKGIDSLMERNLVTAFSSSQTTISSTQSGHTLDEANRCAKLLMQRLKLQEEKIASGHQRAA